MPNELQIIQQLEDEYYVKLVPLIIGIKQGCETKPPEQAAKKVEQPAIAVDSLAAQKSDTSAVQNAAK